MNFIQPQSNIYQGAKKKKTSLQKLFLSNAFKK